MTDMHGKATPISSAIADLTPRLYDESKWFIALALCLARVDGGCKKKRQIWKKFPMAQMFPQFWGPGAAWPVGALSRGACGAL